MLISCWRPSDWPQTSRSLRSGHSAKEAAPVNSGRRDLVFLLLKELWGDLKVENLIVNIQGFACLSHLTVTVASFRATLANRRSKRGCRHPRWQPRSSPPSEGPRNASCPAPAEPYPRAFYRGPNRSQVG